MIETNSSAPIRRSQRGWDEILLDVPQGMADELQAGYVQPSRHYHDAQHVGAIWETWKIVGKDPADLSIMLAAAYHDLVYDPKARPGENEMASAQRLLAFATTFDRMEYSPRVIAEATLMILGTADHLRAGDGLTPFLARRVRLFCDLDLSGLAADYEGFRDNADRIRLEYAHVPEEDFRAGRNAFYRTFLAAPQIFRSGLVPHWWEGAARLNIERALTEDNADGD